MPVPALPKYLGDQDFAGASPGLRFGFYLPIWTSRADQEKEVDKRAGKRSPEAGKIRRYLEGNGMDATIEWMQGRERNRLDALWSKNKPAADHAWRDICKLTQGDREMLSALAARQRVLSTSLNAEITHSLCARAIAPFSTGLGNEHPLENGFAFLWPYGLPYLPGSGVKGVLRQAARELAEGRWGDTRGWTGDAITALFGIEDSTEASRGVLTFWDVIPQIKGNELAVEVMTPHQTNYYRGKETPHDSGEPTPIFFLTVPADSGFDFYVTCNHALLRNMAPELLRENGWRELLQAAFAHAFDWLGFGAKTSVGYGAMRIDHSRENELHEQAEKEAARRQHEAELAAMPAVERDIVEIMEKNSDNPAIALLHELDRKKWEHAEDCRRVAEKIRELWQQEGKWNPEFGGKNRQKIKQKQRCTKVLGYLQDDDD